MKKSHQPPRGNLLIVEDEKIIAKDITNTLKKLGYGVLATVSSAEEAILKLDTTKVDLVLMDIFLKGDLDGIKAGRQIYERFNIPVVHLTAYADEDTLEQLKEADSFGYVRKPFHDGLDILMAIEMALHRHRRSEDQDNAEDRNAKEMLRDLQQLRKYSDFKDSIFKKFLRDLSEPLMNLNVAIRLLKENPVGPKSEHYLDIISEEFDREVELINKTSDLEALMNLENVELLDQSGLLKHQTDVQYEERERPQPQPVLQAVPAPIAAPEPVVVRSTPSPSPKAEKSSSSSRSSSSSQGRPLNQTQLAERLGVVVSAITYWKFKAGFSEWSRSKDPEGIAWKYSPDSKRFSPA